MPNNEELPVADKYYIKFDTRINPGKIEAVTVSINLETISNMDDPMRIDLADHPLYKDLVRYIKENPR